MFATTFDEQDRSFRNKKTGTALFATLFIHGGILLILFFWILHTPVPPFEDNAGGMSVNYGTDETGQGDIQPFTFNPGPTAAKASAQANTEPVQQSTAENVITDEESETDVVVPKPDDKPKPKVNKKALYKPTPKKTNTEVTTASTAKVENPVPQPKADPNALFSKGAYGQPNNSRGDGTGGPQGDQGKPDGDPNSKNYLGDGGQGNGHGGGHGDLNGGYSLHGRKNIGLPPPTQCGTQGRVVIDIEVDRTGKIVNATFKRFASTVFDDCNVNNALTAARKAQFNPDANAPEIQKGTITYIYKVN